MDKIKKLLVKIHAIGVFTHKRLARGILLNHLEAITFITM
jgi:urease gamma subunit